MTKQKKKPEKDLNFEDKLWNAADKLRGSMDASEYKHIVLGLIFLKYISDSFGKRKACANSSAKSSLISVSLWRDGEITCPNS